MRVDDQPSSANQPVDLGDLPVRIALRSVAEPRAVADRVERQHGDVIAIVSLYPGLVATEAVVAAGVFDLSKAESPEFVGQRSSRWAPIRRRCSGRGAWSSPPRWRATTDLPTPMDACPRY